MNNIIDAEPRKGKESRLSTPDLEKIIALTDAKPSGGGFIGKCPAHDDKTPSFSFKEDRGKLVCQCFAGCDYEQIVDELKAKDAWPEHKNNDSCNSQKSIEYHYRNEDGSIAYTVHKKKLKDGSKKFYVYCKGQWKHPPKEEKIIYNSPGVKEALQDGKRIFFCEGEKDAETLISKGLAATAHLGGANAFIEQYLEPLTEAVELIILADNDKAGKAWAKKLLNAASKKGIRVKLLTPYKEIKGGDVTDYFENGGNPEGLLEMLQEANFELADPSKLSEEEKSMQIFLDKYENHNILFLNSFFWLYDCNGLWEKVSDDKIRSLVSKAGISKVTNSKVNALTGLLKARLFKSKFEWNRGGSFINCLNSEVYLEKGKIKERPHQRENYSTSRIQTSLKLDAKCPNWKEFLNSMFGELDDGEERVAALRDMFAYSLMRTAKYEKFFMLYGLGGTGKSTIINVLSAIVGEKNCSSVPYSELSHKFKKSLLYNKLVNFSAEVSTRNLPGEEEVKKIVSGDKIVAEFKGKDAFEFRPYCTLIFACNSLPPIRDVSNAMFQRAIIIRFEKIFRGTKYQDINLLSKLKKELPGILNWALEGYCMVQETNTLTVPLSSKEETCRWEIEANSVKQFVVESPIRDKELLEDLYQRYKDYCENQEISRSVEKKTFSRRLREIGFEVKKSTQNLTYVFPPIVSKL